MFEKTLVDRELHQNYDWQMNARCAVYFLLFASAMSAQVAQMSVTPAEAKTHLVKCIEATTPPLAKAAKIGGVVKLQVTISSSGEVVAVKTISGHPMLIASAIEAARKWKYRPFELAGNPIQVTTDVELNFPGGMSEDESAIRNKLFPIEDECRGLLNKGNYSEAESKCRKAVELSDQLPKNVILERSTSRSLLANSIFLQRRIADAIPLYEEALKLDQGYLKSNDADLASDYWNLGRAYAATGQLTKADALYATAVSTFEAAIQNLPDMKVNYTRRLKRSLNEYAQLKEAEGQTDAAEQLRTKASRL